MTTTLTRPTDAAPGGRRRRWPRLVAAVLVVVVLAAVSVVGWVAGQVWWTGRHDDRSHADAIVVLGASQYDGRPSPVLQWRLVHARVLYDQGVSAQVVTVGGRRPGDRFTEGGTGRSWLLRHGVPDGAVTALPEGSDTWQSMQLVARLAQQRGWRHVVLVSDPWHLYRAQAMAERLGLDATTSPVRGGPVVQSRAIEVRYIVRETAAFLYWRLLGHSPPGGGPAAV